ncbi:MAG TPA: ATP-grasp domain-containing protein [Actinobacteria bacterium]|nr:ATP-grasp domain-containing protein [Actinomycetota bacterium]
MKADSKNYVLIVGAGDLVMPAYKIAREELGLGVIALDYNPKAPGMLYADKSLLVSTKDVQAAVDAAKEISKKCKLKGVFTCGADVEVTVAAIAEALSLPGIPVEVARRCNNKLLMHKYLDDKGFKEKANYLVANNLTEAYNAAKLVQFPCVLKPIGNCASRGIQRIEKPEEVEAAYKLAVNYNEFYGGKILVEECLEGTKHTVEMIVWNNQWHLLSIIDTHYISPRWPCETGLNTTLLSKELQERSFQFSKRLADLVGINFGAHKVDINIVPDGKIKLIELTARLSGGFHCQYASPLAFGSHDIRAALKLAIGQPLDFNDIQHRYEKGSAVKAVFPDQGRITSISGVEEAKKSPGVEEIFIWKKIGDQVGPFHNSADRPAFVIAKGETTDEAIANAKRGAALIKIQTKSNGD